MSLASLNLEKAQIMFKLARKNNWTNTEFLREHLLARAKGEVTRKAIEEENETK